MKKQNLKKQLQKLERKKIITKKPKPIYPFLLTIIAFLIWYFSPNPLLKEFTFLLATFTFIFAILHWVVVLILEN